MLQLAKRAGPYLLCFALGFGTSEAVHKDPEPVAVERVVERQVEATREAVATRHIVTKVTKPDGTVTERAEDRAQTVKSERKDTAKATEHVSTPSPAKTRYSLGLDYLPSFSRAPSWRDTRAEFGARLGDSNVWAIGSYDLQNKQASIGLRYEW